MKKIVFPLFAGVLLWATGAGIVQADGSTFTYSTLAGTPGSVVNSAEGSGSAAQFHSPRGVGVDGSGNIFVADSANNTIRKVTAAGTVSTFAGTAGSQGSADGTGSAARFTEPFGVAVDTSGNLYVADTSNNRIRKITAAGVVTTLAGGSGQGSTDGTGTAARFNEPRGVAVDGSGNVYVADYQNHTLRKITPAGVVSTLAGSAGASGSSDGTGSAARFKSLQGVAVDTAGNVYVADTANRTIRKVTAAGVVTTLAGTAEQSGSTDGSGAVARFSEPRGITVDSTGTLYVADYTAHTLRKVTSAGVVSTLAGRAGTPGTTDATGTAARFYYPSGVSVDSAGNLYVADTSNNTLRKITSAGIVSTLAGLAGRSSSVDATGSAARFEDPYALAADGSGNIYIADATDHSIRKITPAGVVTTLAGSAGSFGSTDGTGSAARFFGPLGIAADSAGTVYVADTGNMTIRKITPAGVVTTFAGTAGSGGATDGTGAAARFSSPYGVAVDTTGTVYVVDGSTIRKITAAGVVSTLAGAQGSNGFVDGTGTAARFLVPFDLTVDSLGNVYVCDHGNHAVRKITPAGVVTTLAGSGTAGSSDGTGTAASFRFPSGISVNGAGTVFVADTDNQVLRSISPAGVVTTVGGTAASVGSTDGVGSAARFFNPKDVAVDGSGNLYITDRGNHTVRKGSLSAGVPQCTLTAQPGTIAAGSSSTLTATCSPAATSYTWSNTGFASSASGGTVSPTSTTTYSVVGNNASGAGSSASATVTVATAPGAPTINSLVAGAGKITVGFTAPASNGGSAITGYTASCSASGKTTRSAQGSASPIVVSGLSGGTVYACTVTASNLAGSGVASSTLSATPRRVSATSWFMLLLDDDNASSGSLSPPTSVAVARVNQQTVGSNSFSSSTQLSVSWTAPSSYVPDHYLVTASETVGGTSVSVSSSVSPGTLTGLKSGTSYSIVVKACGEAACTTSGSATAVTASTPDEYWQLQGTAGSNTTAGLTRIVSDGNVRISATRFGAEAGGSTASRIQLYYGPSGSTSPRQALTTALTGSATSAASSSSYLSFVGSGATTGLISPSTAATLVKTIATGQGVPLSSAMGGKLRLFFEATGADNKTRIFTIDSVDAYVGQDFNSGAATTCSTTADYSSGGGCALTTIIGVEGDSSGANSKIGNARQNKVGYPTQTDWRWDGAAGTFMVFTTDSISGCSSYGMNHGYAVWNGSAWEVQYATNGCPKLFTSAQAAFPMHLGGVAYKLYYGDPSITTGKFSGSLPFLGPKKLIYADGTRTGLTDRVDFEDWEAQSAARNVNFLWPNGDLLDATAEGYIDDYHFLAPTASLDLQVMYLAITNGSEVPFAAAAILLNP